MLGRYWGELGKGSGVVCVKPKAALGVLGKTAGVGDGFGDGFGDGVPSQW